MGTVMVTGAAGFIGSHLCEALLARGDRVVGVDNFDSYYDPQKKRHNVSHSLQHSAFHLHEKDICDATALDRIVRSEKVQGIVHLAALAGVRSSVTRAADYVQTNVYGTCNVLEAARQAQAEQVVVASTSSVYGATKELPFVETDTADRPLAPYPATKRAAEVLAHAYYNMHGLNVAVVRLFSVYGPRGRPDMMPYQIAQNLLSGDEVNLFNGGQMWRDWTYVSDIVAGLMSALDHPRSYEIYNLGRGEAVLMSDLITCLEELSGRRVVAKHVAAPASEPVKTCADIRKARRHFGYNPTVQFHEGLAQFWQWRIDQPGELSEK